MPKKRRERVDRARQEQDPDPAEFYADGLDLHRRLQRMAMDELAEIIEAQKNRGFRQFYAGGFALLRVLLRDQKTVMAARLFLLLAEHCNRQNILLASQRQIADALKVHPKSVQRASKTLESLGALKRIQVYGAGYAYCLPPSMIWSGKNDEKDFAPFVTGRLEKRQSKELDGPIVMDFRAFTSRQKKQESATEKSGKAGPTATKSDAEHHDVGCDNGEEDIYASDEDIGLEPYPESSGPRAGTD